MKTIPLILMGCGGVGSHLLQHIVSCRSLHSSQGLFLRVVGVRDSKSLVVVDDLLNKGLDDSFLLELCRLKQGGESLSKLGDFGKCQVFVHPESEGKIIEIASQLGKKTGLAFVDCTASSDTIVVLKQVVDLGCCVVMANKKPLTSTMEDFEKLLTYPRRIRHESTVGAGLPVISSLNRIISSGDPVNRIVGSLSGTLGYVMSEVEDGKPLSQVVRAAKSLGYTEPDPRDDLGGMDVARKALILARILGRRINMDSIQIESLYPKEMGPDVMTVDDFLNRGLLLLDKDIQERVEKAASNGNVLRYVCVIEDTRCEVGIQELPKNSALGRLRGSDNVLEIYTRCYSNHFIMAMRDLITGATSCPDPSSSSSSQNPLGSLANALIGSSSKTQERLKEIPTSTSTPSASQFYSQPLTQLPGSEFDKPFLDDNSQGSEFLNRFRSAGTGGFDETWDEIQRDGSQLRLYDGRGQLPPQLHQPTLDGTPQRVLSTFLHSFLDSSRGGIPFHPAPLPVLGLSEGDKQCIRDRSSIMARHLFADKSEEFIHAQVNALLSSLDIDSNVRGKGPMPERHRELEDYWNESQGNLIHGAHASDGWITEFSQNRERYDNPDTWANSFEQQHGANGWASEFEHSQLSSVDQMRGMNMPNIAAMEQTRMLANTLAQNADPKFQNSKFLQFVSKMSRGELIIDDNQVKETALPAPGDWAAEYQQQYNHGGAWAGEFLNDKAYPRVGPELWANEFAFERQQNGAVDDQWVDEFSKLNVNDWAEEFGQQVGEGAFGEGSSDNWAQAYDEFLNEQVAAKQRSDSSRGVYVFSDLNPYVGHPNPLKEGQDLFRKGLLSEAVLALEAEVLKNPENAEGWRLLGIAHAENDDDQQAIAAMMRAQEADPTNLEVLLALGVSHTNELEQNAALKYLFGWLRNHPKYGTIAPPEMSDSLYYADVARLFNEAAVISPDDADVHIVLGVLYNLSREYDKAIAAFEQALKLKPQDYSLWNKLGATQANSVQSADAITAYQQALDLKPNYVRAWANMGISYANQGMYDESIRYYVRALAMNPKAENAWQYLRISLSCASRNDMLEACDSRNLDLLQKEFPLQ